MKHTSLEKVLIKIITNAYSVLKSAFLFIKVCIQPILPLYLALIRPYLLRPVLGSPVQDMELL